MDILQFLVNYIVHCNILQSPPSSLRNAVVGGRENVSLSMMAEMGFLKYEECIRINNNTQGACL